MHAQAFRPTEYAAALIQVLRQRAGVLAMEQVVELGIGSGVVLAEMLRLGATHALGIDIEPEAVRCTRRLLEQLGVAERAELRQGDLWAPCEGRRFDLVVTNLPQFPTLRPLGDGRLPSWSGGGADGRALIDRFLDGLAAHLQPEGLAFMTHNRFSGIDETLRSLTRAGLRGRAVATVCVPLSVPRWQSLPPALRQRHLGDGLLQVGEHAFGEFQVLEISRAAARA